MSRLPERVAALLLLAALAGFAYFNAGERVTLRLGVFIIAGIPLSVVITGSALLGMLAAFAVGLRADLRLRRLLRGRLARDP